MKKELQSIFCYDRIAANVLNGTSADNKASKGVEPVLHYFVESENKTIAQLIEDGRFTTEDEVIEFLNENGVSFEYSFADFIGIHSDRFH